MPSKAEVSCWPGVGTLGTYLYQAVCCLSLSGLPRAAPLAAEEDRSRPLLRTGSSGYWHHVQHATAHNPVLSGQRRLGDTLLSSGRAASTEDAETLETGQHNDREEGITTDYDLLD